MLAALDPQTDRRKSLNDKPPGTFRHPEASSRIRVSEGTRTPDSQIHNLEHTGQNSRNSRHSEEDQPLLTPCLHKNPTDPDLAEVVTAWTRLPEAIKAGVLALVRAAR